MSPKIQQFESLETCSKQQPPPSSTRYFQLDTCIRVQHVADTCRHRRHGCIRRIHVFKRDMWWIHVAVGNMDVSEGYMYPSATCIRYMYLVDGDLYTGNNEANNQFMPPGNSGV